MKEYVIRGTWATSSSRVRRTTASMTPAGGLPKTMGHGTDTKFYVVKVEVPDDIAGTAFKHTNLDGIGNARYIEVDDLNKYGEVKQVNSVRAGNH